MVRKVAIRGMVGAMATLVASANLVAPAHATDAVALAKAGTVAGWGTSAAQPAYALPGALQETPFTQVAAGSGFSIALTAAGKIAVLGTSETPGIFIEEIPSALNTKQVTQITASSNNAGAITSTGEVVVWGQYLADDPDLTEVPAGLTGATSLALGGYSAAAVKSDGTVVAWGLDLYGETAVPPGLTGVKSVVAGSNQFYALKTNGTVAAWGRATNNQLVLPPVLTDTTDSIDVTAISARAQGGLALLSNGTLVNWGQASSSTNAVPAALAGKTIKLISTLASNNVALATDGTLAAWGATAPTELTGLSTLPAPLTVSDVAFFSIGGNHIVAIATKVLPLAKPSVTGTATVGKTLTATPSEFSGGPTAVAGQWLADGVEIEGATSTTLTLSAAQLGKRITYASTATKAPAAPVIALSVETVPVQPDVVASTTSLAASTRAYGSTGTASVTVSNTGGRPVTGTVTLTGAGAAQTRTLVGGKATFALPKTLTPRRYALKATYSGNADLTTSNRTSTYTVVRGRTSAPTFKASKTPTSKKSGKATVTVNTPSGLAKATGRVTVTIKGKSKKTIRVTLSGGKRTVTLPKLKKGSYKVTLVYGGDSRYNSAKSRTYSLKVKK